MPDNLSDLSKSATQEINECSSTTELDSLRVKYLGKKGAITIALKSVSSVDPKDRQAYGKKINELKS
jgi:Phenylalanyl-tRNA synthetase alpha subunit